MLRFVAIALMLALLASPVEARKRRHIKRVKYRKPPIVYCLPDVIQPISYAEYWAIEQRKREAAALAMWAMLAARWW